MQRDLGSCRRAKGWTAVSSLHRLGAQLEERLSALEAQEGDGEEQVLDSDEALLRALVDAVPGLPDEALDQLEDAIRARRTNRPLMQIVRGG